MWETTVNRDRKKDACPERSSPTACAARPLSSVARHAQQELLRTKRLVIVTKLRFMGDTIVSTPFLSELRKFVPSTRITLVTSPTAAQALTNCPFADEIVPLSIQGKGRLQQGQELYKVLRDGHFDGAFLANRSFHCAAMTALARIPLRIGFDNEYRRFLLTLPVRYDFHRHEVDHHLDLLRALGLSCAPALPRLWIDAAERNRAQELLRNHGWRPEKDRPLIAFQPGANDANIRAWPGEHYAHIADRLAKELGAKILIMGGTDERGAAQTMEAAMQIPALNMVGKLELRHALSVIGLCDLWIGNDTGLLHAAVAQEVPSVGMFGPNKVIRWGYSTPCHRSLAVFPEKPARDDATIRRCLEAISEEDVYRAAYEAYSAAKSTGDESPENKGASMPTSLFFGSADPENLTLPVRRR